MEKITREKRNTMIGRMGAMLTPLTEPLGFNQQMEFRWLPVSSPRRSW